MPKLRAYKSDLSAESVADTISITGARLGELPDGLPHLRIEPEIGNGLEFAAAATVNAWGHSNIAVSKLQLKIGTGLAFDGVTGAVYATGGGGGGGVGTTTNPVTFNSSGTGGASGSTFDGSVALTVSYNTIGAAAATGTNASGSWGISITGSAATVANALTFNNGGAGAASGTTFNGSVARTISYNTVGAPSTTGTNASGTWSISISGSAASVANALTFNNAGTGVVSGTTFNGAAARTISYNTIGAPSTTGTNASGTWSISISGSAATLTTARSIWGQSFNGSADVTGALSNATTGVFSSTVTASDFVLSSDVRFKTDLRPLYNALHDMDTLYAFRYHNVRTEKTEVGVLAQQVRMVLPEAVVEDADGFLGVSYDRLVPFLLAALKELKGRVVYLEHLARS